jgi:hypothetical protein
MFEKTKKMKIKISFLVLLSVFTLAVWTDKKQQKSQPGVWLMPKAPL